MKFLAFGFVLMSLVVVSCGDQNTTSENTEEGIGDLLETMDQMAGQGTTEWLTKSDNEHYEIEIPSYMERRHDLNEQAILQYGYDQVEGLSKVQLFCIVLQEMKDSIAKFNLDFSFDAKSYSQICIESLQEGLDTAVFKDPDPHVHDVNGMDCVTAEIDGAKGEAEAFWLLSVFEGQKAFYQVLVWCTAPQKERFKADMYHITKSFKEIN